jgi:hypothetical protein
MSGIQSAQVSSGMVQPKVVDGKTIRRADAPQDSLALKRAWDHAVELSAEGEEYVPRSKFLASFS